MYMCQSNTSIII